MVIGDFGMTALYPLLIGAQGVESRSVSFQVAGKEDGVDIINEPVKKVCKS